MAKMPAWATHVDFVFPNPEAAQKFAAELAGWVAGQPEHGLVVSHHGAVPAKPRATFPQPSGWLTIQIGVGEGEWEPSTNTVN